MKLKSLLVLLLAGIWGVGSWWWYTCKVKGFCGADTTTAQVAAGASATGVAALSDSEKSDEGKVEGDIDGDGDGIPDSKEAMLGLDPTKADSDGDGVADAIEIARDPQDTDGDGTIDALDDDDDGDGIMTAQENPDPNGDGNVDDAADQDGNKLADYLDASAGKAKADAEQAASDKAKADAEQAASDKAKADAEQAASDKAKADAEDGKVTMETSGNIQGTDIGPVILHFPTGSANPQLADDTKAYFAKVAQFLKDNSGSKVTIVGHTDNKGDPAKNKALGLKRAEMLQKALVDLGVSKDRVLAASEGANKPIADNSTEQGREKNRRVEITPVK